MPSYYMVVETYENWLQTKEKQFTEKAFKDKQSRIIIRSIVQDDILVYYISSGLSVLGGMVKVVSSLRIRNDLYWDDFYNIRYETEPIIILEENQFVPFRSLIEKLAFVKNKIRWANYVYHSIRRLNPSDFNIMQTAIMHAARK